MPHNVPQMMQNTEAQAEQNNLNSINDNYQEESLHEQANAFSEQQEQRRSKKHNRQSIGL